MAEIVGVWTPTRESLDALQVEQCPDHLAAIDHAVVLVADHTCQFRSFDRYPGRFHWEDASYVSEPESCDWQLVPASIGGVGWRLRTKPTWMVSVRLDPNVERAGPGWISKGRDMPVVPGVTFYVTRSGDELRLWNFLGDRDGRRYMEFQRR